MFPEVERVLVSRTRIHERVGEMARDLVRDLEQELARENQTLQDEGRVVFVPIMTGAMIFVADLIREMPVKLSLGLIAVSSYPGETVTSKGAQLEGELPDNLAGKHVVIIDDILDSGRTLALVRSVVEQRNPASIRIVVLLDKTTKRAVEVEADHVGFEIPDEFVVGYGLDYNGYYRNHPEIAVLRPDVIPAREGERAHH